MTMRSPTRRSLVTTLLCTATLALAASVAAQAPAPKPAPPPAPAAATPAERIAERVQAFYDKTKTFKATFKQVYTAKAYNKTKEATGSVIFQKPGKMSWRYTNNGNRIVSDGKLIKVYEKENKQMYEQPLEEPIPGGARVSRRSGQLEAFVQAHAARFEAD